VESKNIAKAFVTLVVIAAVFATGLYFGRTGGPGDFTVTTQYAAGAMSEAELNEMALQVAERAERDAARQPAATTPTAPPSETAEAGSGLVNINTAGVDGLMTLPGVGPAIAERIIAHREAHGPFRIIEEITDVSGIGPARFADIRDRITVE